jgi:3-deoxy-D-manno-octulosonate 8-phosphate phosphatase (KDO 8-P phosphatase)
MPSDKLKRIKLLLLDVDGVLTDGTIIYDDKGVETKMFNVKDGLGIKMLIKAGIKVGIVTGRASKALYHRCDDLGISLIFDRARDKAGILDVITKQTGISAEHIAFVADDLVDLPLMRKVGLSIAVADAHEMLLQDADMVTAAKGGAGAVREVCEAILKGRGVWEKTLERLL